MYDIQDESDRNAAPRPFPFLPTVDPSQWSAEALAGVSAPRITYKSVPSQQSEELTRWLSGRSGAAVLVGAPSKRAGGLSLSDAYQLARTRRSCSSEASPFLNATTARSMSIGG